MGREFIIGEDDSKVPTVSQERSKGQKSTLDKYFVKYSLSKIKSVEWRPDPLFDPLFHM